MTDTNEDAVSAVLQQIEKQRRRRLSNKVLHGHPSPMHWLERNPPMRSIFEARRRADAVMRRETNLYVATPYCLKTEPERCGFCLFPSEDFRGQAQLETYLRFLEKEAEMLRPYCAGREVATIYFGGGTSNLYRADAYDRLVRVARDLYDVPADAEITLEGIPQLFTQEKLAAMKEAGVTRVSIGAQQLDDDMIRLSGRRQTAQQVFDAIAWCQALDLDVSVDLIFGWPGQTVDNMLSDLRAIVATGIRHITHYELNVAGRSDFARNHRATLPSIEENVALFEESCRFLEAAGFRQATVYDWERVEGTNKGRYRYEENLRNVYFAEPDGSIGRGEMHGLGFAGVSVTPDLPEAPGWTFVNHTRVDDYFAALDRGEFPVDRAYHHEVEDLRILYLFQSLQAMHVDRAMYRRVFSIDVAEEFAPVWEAFARLGWIERSEDAIRTIGEGVVRTPLIQTVLAAERVEQVRTKARPGDGMGRRLVQIRLPAHEPAHER